MVISRNYSRFGKNRKWPAQLGLWATCKTTETMNWNEPNNLWEETSRTSKTWEQDTKQDNGTVNWENPITLTKLIINLPIAILLPVLMKDKTT